MRRRLRERQERVMNHNLICKVMGLTLALEGGCMLLPLVVSLLYGERSLSLIHIFYTDFKPFACDEVHFGIGQSSFMSDRSAQKAKDLLLPYLDEVREREGLDLVCYMLTNILTESTELIYAGFHAGAIVGHSFPDAAPGENSVFLPGVVSRKKQMVPNLTRGINEWQSVG